MHIESGIPLTQLTWPYCSSPPFWPHRVVISMPKNTSRPSIFLNWPKSLKFTTTAKLHLLCKRSAKTELFAQAAKFSWIYGTESRCPWPPRLIRSSGVGFACLCRINRKRTKIPLLRKVTPLYLYLPVSLWRNISERPFKIVGPEGPELEG